MNGRTSSSSSMRSRWIGVALMLIAVQVQTACTTPEGERPSSSSRSGDDGESTVREGGKLLPTGSKKLSSSQGTLEFSTHVLSDYSSSQVFRGLILGDGPVADDIPAIRQGYRVSNVVEGEELDATRRFMDRVLKALEESDPDALAVFKSDIMSGDHVRINEAMVRGSKMAREAISLQPEVQLAQSQGHDDARGLCFIGPFVIAVAVAFGAVVAVNVVGSEVLAVAHVDLVAFVNEYVVGGGGDSVSGVCADDGSGCDTSSKGMPLLAGEVIDDLAEVTVPVWSWGPDEGGPGYTVKGAQDFYTGDKQLGLQLADFNGDGEVDKLYYEYSDDGADVVDIFTESGCSGGCAPAFSGPYPEGGVPVIGDYNGDRIADIMWWTLGEDHEIWLFRSDATFTTVTTTHTTTANTGTVEYQVVAGDFNGDGYDDLFWYGHNDQPDDIQLGGPGWVFASVALPPIGEARQIYAGKFLNGDGDDIIFYDGSGLYPSPHPVWDIEPGATPGTFNITSYTLDQSSGFVPAIADLNADGRDDVYWYFGHAYSLATGEPVEGPDMTWVWNTETGFVVASGDGPGRVLYPEAGDLSRDGYPEIVWWPYPGRFLPAPPTNSPPDAGCQDVSLFANDSCVAAATIYDVNDGTSDPDGDRMTGFLDPPGPYPLGDTDVVFHVTDSRGLTDSCAAVISVEDNTPPTLNVSNSNFKSCSVDSLPIVKFPEGRDNCATIEPEGVLIESNGVPVDPPQPISTSSVLPIGTHVIEWRADDGFQDVSVTETVTNKPLIQASLGFVLNDRSEIQGTLFNSGSGATQLGTDTRADDIVSVGPVDIQWRSYIEGDIISSGSIFVRPDVGVAGTRSPSTPIALPGFPSLPTIPTGTGDIYASSTPITLPPGAYRSLTLNSNAHVTLVAGTYSFSNGLTINSASKLVVEPNTRILVARSLAMRSPFVNGSGGIQPVFVGYSGQNLVLETDFDGVLLAPNAHVQFGVGQTLDFRGSFFGKRLELRPDVTLTCDESIGAL